MEFLLCSSVAAERERRNFFFTTNDFICTRPFQCCQTLLFNLRRVRLADLRWKRLQWRKNVSVTGTLDWFVPLHCPLFTFLLCQLNLSILKNTDYLVSLPYSYDRGEIAGCLCLCLCYFFLLSITSQRNQCKLSQWQSNAQVFGEREAKNTCDILPGVVIFKFLSLSSPLFSSPVVLTFAVLPPEHFECARK